MEIAKDFTADLAKAETKDKYYMIQGKIKRLLAPQFYSRPFTYKKKGWGTIERTETQQDGTPTDKRSPRKSTRMRRGEEEIKTADCWTFKVEKSDGKLRKDDHIFIGWGDHFGLLKSSLRRSLEAQRKLRYEAAPLALIKVYPVWLDLGKAPCESLKEGRIPEVILETRHTQRGDVMVEAFFDFVENREFTCYLEIDSECPLNDEKLVGMVKSLNTLDTIGAAKRGSMQITKIAQIKLTDEELKKLESGEPVQPVIY
jgi:hypothetical protein